MFQAVVLDWQNCVDMGEMMKVHFVYMLIGALISGATVFFIMKEHSSRQDLKNELTEIKTAESSVKERLNLLESRLTEQLNAFSEMVSNDKNFSLKLFVENDTSSSEVVDIAGRYIKAMDFSVLKVVDSANTIISSGHFPASRGLNVSEQIALISNRPSIVEENIMGSQVLTMQVKHQFKIEDFSFFAVGGFEINNKLLQELSPWDKVKVLLKNGNNYIGMNGIRSISEIKDNRIIINDKEYFASQIPFPSARENNAVSLFIIIEK